MMLISQLLMLLKLSLLACPQLSRLADTFESFLCDWGYVFLFLLVLVVVHWT